MTAKNRTNLKAGINTNLASGTTITALELREEMLNIVDSAFIKGTDTFTVTKTDIGLGNVDNTSDINKPISNATQSALNAKADDTDIPTTFDGLSDGITNKAFTATEKTKLSSVAVGATANATDAFLLSRTNHTDSQSADTIVDGTNNKAYTTAEKTKLSSVETGATANDTDANLKARANHTGVQSADTIIDGSTNKVYTAAEQTKLAGVASGATANSTDAFLLNRANHTGMQATSTITGLDATLANLASTAPANSIVGPGSSTDNTLVRYNGTNGLAAKNSNAVLNDNGSMILTSTSATSFVVGPNGTVNPAFVVDCSAANADTGLKISANFQFNSTNIRAIGASAHIGLLFETQGNGQIVLNTPTASGQVIIRNQNTARLAVSNIAANFTPSSDSAAGTARFLFTGAANSSLTAGTEFSNVHFNLGQTNTHSTGNIAMNRDFRISATTHAASGASTITNASTFSVSGAPIAGANVTITRAYAIEALTGVCYFGDGIVQKSPNGTLYKLTVDDNGDRVKTLIT